jgi:hypothetical protein
MGILSNLTKWQNYVHYLLLTGAIFGIHKLTDIWGIEMAAVNGGWLQWAVLFMFYALGVFVADTIIHLLFAIAPEPIKWED